MPKTILITRPIVDAQPLAEELKQLGYAAIIAPMISISSAPFGYNPADVQAVLITSANGVRALAAQHAPRDMLIICVGDMSAHVARDLGFTQVESAADEGYGDVEKLAEYVTQHVNAEDGALLHVAGSVQAGDLQEELEAAGYRITREVGYHAQAATAMDPLVAEHLHAGTLDGTMFFSPRTARIFCELAAGLPLDSCQAICLSDAVADALSGDWQAAHVAKLPTTAAMLQCLRSVL